MNLHRPSHAIAAVTLGIVMIIAACASSPAFKAMTGAYAACAKADLGEIVTDTGLTLEQAVAQEIKGNPTTLEADLKTLLGKVGLDAIVCAVTAVEAALTTPAAGSATTPSASQPLPGLLRAKAFIKAQKG